MPRKVNQERRKLVLKAASKSPQVTAPQIALLLSIPACRATQLLHAMRAEGLMVRTRIGDHTTHAPAEWRKAGKGAKDAQHDTRNYLAELMCPAVTVPRPSLVVKGGATAPQHCEWCATPLTPGQALFGHLYCSPACSGADQPNRQADSRHVRA